jgi:bacteriocin biosynthesis cyclodehydratase domain-containing protein
VPNKFRIGKMINTPVFKAHLQVEVIPGEGVLMLSEKAAKALHGDAYEKIIPLLDGQHSADQIVDTLAGQVDAAKVYYVLTVMEAKGYIVEATPAIPVSVAAFWYGVDIAPIEALRALQDKQVAVLTVGEVDATVMLPALEAMGVRIGNEQNADLCLVLTDDYLHTDLAKINAAALQVNRPWLLVRVTGSELWLGPLIQPGETGCWACLRQRLERNRAVHRFIADRNNLSTPPLTALGTLPATHAAACQMAAIAATQFLAGAATGLEGKVLSLDWDTHTAQSHTLVRHPHCPSCGTAEHAVMQPMQLQPGKAAFVRDGGHRSVAPEQTLKKYQHLVSPITGVVRMLVPVREDDGIAYVYMAGHNHAMKMDRLIDLKQGLRNSSSGKGMSETQAKVSALCEAIERYSGELTGGELRLTRVFKDWSENEAIHPNDIMHYSAQQYAERDIWNSKGSRFNRVPELLPENTPIDWTPLWSLTHSRHIYLPTQLMYYRAPASENDQTSYSMGCSNGNASGNTLEEAILQGFFELVERDAVALWWYNRLSKPGVAVETFGEPYLLELAEHYHDHYQRETWALDLTTDLGIPVFVAVSKLIEGKQDQLLFGLGCHLDARIALQRAFAEMNQMLGMAHSGNGGELSLEDGETLEWLRNATVDNQPYMLANKGQPLTRLNDYPLQHSGDFLQDINHCRSIIEGLGMEMLVLDQTRADVGMPVVKVVVPGLRHFWARFAPGRLYDVPVTMGWLDKPLLEAELNSIPIFF